MKLADAVRRGRHARYAAGAWLIAVVPSLLYFFALVAIGVESLHARPGTLDPAVAAYGILLAPLLETALMLLIARTLGLLMPGHEAARIVLLAATFALAHMIGGGWRQVVATLWPSLVYSVTLVDWLRRSVRESFAVTSLVHALYNLTFFAVGLLGALAAGA